MPPTTCGSGDVRIGDPMKLPTHSTWFQAMHALPGLLAALAATSCQGPDAKEDPTVESTTAAVISPTPDFTWRGGRVLPNVEAVVIFWSKNVDSTVKNLVPGFYSSVVKSSYMDWLTEYNTPNRNIGRGKSTGIPFIINPSKKTGTVDDSEIQAELSSRIPDILPPVDGNRAYMVHFPPGLSITETFKGKKKTLCAPSTTGTVCAYHSFFVKSQNSIPYAVIPDFSPGSACAKNCGTGVAGLGEIDDITLSASHELLEMITDPDDVGWKDDFYDEIADPSFCHTPVVIPGTNTIVQRAWSDDSGSCISHNVLFTGPQRWSTFFCRQGETCELANVDFDKKADAVAFQHGVNGETNVWVAPSDGVGSFVPQSAPWLTNFCVGAQTCATGDVDGDGLADAIAFHRGSNPTVEVALSTGSSFTRQPTPWSNFFCLDGEVCKVADVDGDGRADLVAFTHGTKGNSVFVGISTGSGFGPPEEWSTNFCLSNQTCDVGDVTPTARWTSSRSPATARPMTSSSLVLSPPSSGASATPRSGATSSASRGRSAGSVTSTAAAPPTSSPSITASAARTPPTSPSRTRASTRPPTRPSASSVRAAEACAVGDVNGDGQTDIIAFTLSSTATPEAWVSTAFP